ncbi:MAG: hypothetical protein ACI9FB_000542 [Candidatus Azotimanducaceae bacterium]|jgi:uncharacterized protein (TIGR02647 family)
MKLSKEIIAEIELLNLFDASSGQQGLKLHHDASSDRLNAGVSLHEKKLITQIDGGYLTPLGIKAAEHAQSLVTILHEPQA